MTNPTKTLQFNTGRLYTPKGQLIEVKVFEGTPDEWISDYNWHPVLFRDFTRMIWGQAEISLSRYELESSAASIEDKVLSAYDRGQYVDVTGYTYETNQLRSA